MDRFHLRWVAAAWGLQQPTPMGRCLRAVAIAPPDRFEGREGSLTIGSRDPASLFNACRLAAQAAEYGVGAWGASNWAEGRASRRKNLLLMGSWLDDAPRLEALLERQRPNLLLLGSMTLCLPGAVACARLARALLGDDVCIVLGGRHPTETFWMEGGSDYHHPASPLRLMASGRIEALFDFVVSGDGEGIIVEIGEAIGRAPDMSSALSAIRSDSAIREAAGDFSIGWVEGDRVRAVESRGPSLDPDLLPAGVEMFGATACFEVFGGRPTAHVFSDVGRGCAYSYPDFIGLINQWNVPPGALSTVSKWAVFSRLGPSSRLLEIACTTGFSSRELAVLSGCGALGIDLSTRSIARARENRLRHAPGTSVEYVAGDAYEFEPSRKFTHVVLGASLRCFPDERVILERITSWLEDPGYFLVSPFFVRSPIPAPILDEAARTFGFRPTTASYKEVMTPYRDFEILYEDRQSIEQETEEELEHYLTSSVSRAKESLGSDDPDLGRAIRDRLCKIRRMSNRLRPYQGYVVLVLRHRRALHGRRYVELF